MEKKEINLDDPKEFEEYERNFDFSSIKFNFKMSDTDFQLDAIQSQLLRLYLISDKRFRRAFNTNFTPSFLTYLKDKTRLNEPVRLSIMGNVRSGKSFSGLSLCILHQAFYKKLFHPFFICSSAYEYLEKVQNTSPEKLTNRIFLIDEEKNTFGIGSLARKTKLEDTQHIIAIRNISTIMLTPHSWQDRTADYGLRTMGRCFNIKVNRLMLYNLQEKSNGLPMGNLYLPIFTELIKNEYGIWLEKKYLEKKNKWVNQEQQGTGDILETLKKKTAVNFIHDPKFMALKTKKQRLDYITLKMGSEWTSGEKEIIEGYTKLLKEGAIDENELKEE